MESRITKKQALCMLVIFIISTFFAQTISGFSGSAKLIMTLIFGALGGIVGVNSKSRRF